MLISALNAIGHSFIAIDTSIVGRLIVLIFLCASQASTIAKACFTTISKVITFKTSVIKACRMLINTISIVYASITICMIFTTCTEGQILTTRSA